VSKVAGRASKEPGSQTQAQESLELHAGIRLLSEASGQKKKRNQLDSILVSEIHTLLDMSVSSLVEML
jgi:hypothetical protein